MITTQCAVTLDGQLWPDDDFLPRPVRHGSYAQVIVPPPPNNDTPTQIAVEIAQQPLTDHEMEELFGPISSSEDSHQAPGQEEDDDTLHLTQLAVQYRCHPFKCRGLPEDVDRPDMPLGAVLRSKSDLNPQARRCMDTASNTHETCTNMEASAAGSADSNATSSAPVNAANSPDLATPTQVMDDGSADRNAGSPKPTGGVPHASGPPQDKRLKQAPITAFFAKKVHKQKSASPAKQSTIHAYFPRASPQVKQAAQDPPGLDLDLTTTPEHEAARQHSGAVQARTGWQHETEAPTFTARLPAQPANPNAPRPRPLWHIELNTVFMDEATTHNREVGPEMSVEVWYVHHLHMPICRAPRLIRLDDVRDLWYADLCNAWFDQIRWPHPLKVHIVKPPPPYQTRPQAAVHIILEQGMTPDRAAILFTAAFHGGTRMGLLQQAESSPVDICTDQIILAHNLQAQCSFRPCHMFSGRYHFHPQNTDRVPSGISVLLDVGDWRTQPSGSASSHEPAQPNPEPEADQDEDDSMSILQDGLALMQRPRYKAFPKPVAKPSPAANMRAQAGLQLWIHKPSAPRDASMHQPVHWVLIQVPNIAEFHQMLQWQADRSQDHCLPTQPRRTKVASWYMEPQTLPRSDHFREVLLNTNPMQWTGEIVQRWADFIIPDAPVSLFVVQPDPPGGDADIIAHVLVVQNMQPHHAAVLVSVTELLVDPWHPSRFVLFMPDQVTRSELFQHAGLPIDHDRRAPGTSAYHGSIPIPPDGTYPARPGFAFEVVTDTLDLEGDAPTMLQLPQIQDGWATKHEHAATGTTPVMNAHNGAKSIKEAFLQIHQQMMHITTRLTQDPPSLYKTCDWKDLLIHGDNPLPAQLSSTKVPKILKWTTTKM